MRVRVVTMGGTGFVDVPGSDPQPTPPPPKPAAGSATSQSAGGIGAITVSAKTEWERELSALMGRGMSRAEAARELATAQPELRRRFIREHNQQHGQRARKGR